MTSVTPQQRLDLALLEVKAATAALSQHNYEKHGSEVALLIGSAMATLENLSFFKRILAKAVGQLQHLHSISQQTGHLPGIGADILHQMDEWVIPLNTHLCEAIVYANHIKRTKERLRLEY